MTPTDRFVRVATALADAGFRFLVMGGHAVRHYGVDRNTLDYDFHLSLEAASELERRLATTGLLPTGQLPEGPSWRPDDFRRFQIGRLPDGREEWLEFWLRNHLLAPFAELWERREEAVLAGRNVSFLSLPDLIRSKETERESDWQDMALLEEILDLRRLANARSDAEKLALLAGLRSRRGFERALAAGHCRDSALLQRALAAASSLISRALLLPGVPHTPCAPPAGHEASWKLLEEPLRKVAPGSARHLALVEAARRFHKQAAMAADRADKERPRAG
jgi:hypothetical protein